MKGERNKRSIGPITRYRRAEKYRIAEHIKPKHDNEVTRVFQRIVGIIIITLLLLVLAFAFLRCTCERTPECEPRCPNCTVRDQCHVTGCPNEEL